MKIFFILVIGCFIFSNCGSVVEEKIEEENEVVKKPSKKKDTKTDKMYVKQCIEGRIKAGYSKQDGSAQCKCIVVKVKKLCTPAEFRRLAGNARLGDEVDPDMSQKEKDKISKKILKIDQIYKDCYAQVFNDQGEDE